MGPVKDYKEAKMNLDIDTSHNFTPYKWEHPIIAAFEEHKEIWINIHRRGGKDLLCFCEFILPSAFERPGTYPYLWPTLKQGRDAIWEGKDEQGRDILNYYVPREMIIRADNVDMKLTVRAIGGTSQIQIFGTNNQQYEALRGKPGNGAVYAEYSRQDPRGRDVISPMLRKTKGWEVYNSTPNGNNHFKRGYYIAKNNPNCFTLTATVEDTYDHKGNRLVTEEDIQKEKDDQRTEDYINQEYYCSFNQGIEGTYLGKQLQIAQNEGRMGNIVYDESVPINTAWDLGVGDFMTIIFYQTIGNRVHILDYLEATGYSFVYYAQKLKDRQDNKGYFYGKHYAPFDIKDREMGSLNTKETKALSRKEKAEFVGIDFEEVERTSFENSVDSARSVMKRCFFNTDSKGVNRLITHLEQWGRKWNDINQEYSDWEARTIHTHAGAAFRYMSTVVMEETHNVGDYEEDEQEVALKCRPYTGF
ncbi:hypothetical protein ES708_14493 [subsurface metagenome]